MRFRISKQCSYKGMWILNLVPEVKCPPALLNQKGVASTSKDSCLQADLPREAQPQKPNGKTDKKTKYGDNETIPQNTHERERERGRERGSERERERERDPERAGTGEGRTNKRGGPMVSRTVMQ